MADPGARGEAADADESDAAAGMMEAARSDAALAWDFDCLALAGGGALEATVARVVWDYAGAAAGLASRGNVDALVRAVAAHMRYGAAYHDFYHAADVVLVSAHLLFAAGGARLLAPLDRLAVMLAALGHDVDHPGTTNAYIRARVPRDRDRPRGGDAFAGRCLMCSRRVSHARRYHVATRSPLALRYAGLPVLEAHSAAVTGRLVRETRALAGLCDGDATTVREAVGDAIVNGTAMGNHAALLDGLARYAGGRRGAPADDVALLRNALVHAADVSNAARPFAVAVRWSDRILAEFFAQGALERGAGLPLSYGCDAATTKQPAFALGFADGVVAPFFAEAARVLPPLEATALAGLDANRRVWVERQEARGA